MRRGFFIGAACVGVLWGMVSCNTDPEVQVKKQIETVYMPETKIKTVTEEVNSPPSDDCITFLDATQDLLEGQALLSQSKGELAEIADSLQLNLANDDPVKVVQLQREMRLVQTKMNNAWLGIGDADATMRVLGDPCREE